MEDTYSIRVVFSNVYFWGCDIFCHLVLIQSIQFSVLLQKYRIHVFDEAFFFLVRVAMITEKVVIPVSTATILRGIRSFISSMQLINLNYLWKNRVKQLKASKKYCRNGVSSSPLLITQILMMESKRSKCIPSWILLPFFISWIDLLNMSYFFLKSPW